MKKYNSSWSAKKLTINFNEKQWRQDLASFIKDRMYWDFTFVTRSRVANKNKYFRNETRNFEIYNQHGGRFFVQYKNGCKVENATDMTLIQEYLDKRTFLYEK